VFVPHRVVFEEAALEYPIGQKIWQIFKTDYSKTTVEILKAKQRISGMRGITPREAYAEGKRTLIVGVRKTLNFQSCKPSAHFQLPLVTGCMGQCEYCYLNTHFGKNPYIRVYVNLDDILNQTRNYIEQRKPDPTIFEGAATSDPVPVEPYTGSLAETIGFFASQEHGSFRFVTKYTDIESLCAIQHQGKTTVRFSINTEHIIKSYEHATPSLPKRLEAAQKICQADYPLGFIIGPVITCEGWKQDYLNMLSMVSQYLSGREKQKLSFEIISHRYTTRAKNIIHTIYPHTSLPMDDDKRQYKYGQFGYGKYIYPHEQMQEIKDFFIHNIKAFFPHASLNYII
jgi:spore photoproduct lyase